MGSLPVYEFVSSNQNEGFSWSIPRQFETPEHRRTGRQFRPPRLRINNQPLLKNPYSHTLSTVRRQQTQLIERTVIVHFSPIARLILNHLVNVLVKVLKEKGKTWILRSRVSASRKGGPISAVDLRNGGRGRTRTSNLGIKSHPCSWHLSFGNPHLTNNLQKSCAHRGSLANA